MSSENAVGKYHRYVMRKLKGERVFQPGEVVDTSRWATRGKLELTRYIRPLYIGEDEELFTSPDGRLWINEQAYVARVGSLTDSVTDERASSAKDEEGSDPSGSASSPEEEDGEEEEEEDVMDRIEAQSIGGGWYNVLVDGVAVNRKSIRSGDLDDYVEQVVTDLRKE